MSCNFKCCITHFHNKRRIFFNEFNRYKKKSESGQVFTPDHITSFMYRLIEVNQNDKVLDAACGSGAFLVKAMCNMMKEAGGINTKKFEMNREMAFFIIPLLKTAGKRYAFIDKWKKEDMEKSKIPLPVDKDGNPDYKYMENHIVNKFDMIKIYLTNLVTSI